MTWPTDAAWQQWWSHAIGDVEAELDLVEGRLVAAGDDTGMSHETGPHLQPGAAYRAETPELTVGTIQMTVGGRSRHRTVLVEYQEVADAKRAATLHLDGPDRLTSVEIASTLRHLSGVGWFRPGEAHAAHLTVDLDWLRVRLDARIDRGPRGQFLVAELRLRGRGVWRPVLAPFLSAGRLAVSRGFERELTKVAETLTRIAADPTVTLEQVESERREADLQERLDLIERRAAVLRDRFETAHHEVSARRWWSRGSKRWKSAYQRLGPLSAVSSAGEPPLFPPVSFLGAGDSEMWELTEELALDHIVRDRHRRARERFESSLASFVDSQREAAARLARGDQISSVGVGDLGPDDDIRVDDPELEMSLSALTDEMMDWSFLATPWTTLGKAVGTEHEAEARSALYGWARGRG